MANREPLIAIASSTQGVHIEYIIINIYIVKYTQVFLPITIATYHLDSTTFCTNYLDPVG